MFSNKAQIAVLASAALLLLAGGALFIAKAGAPKLPPPAATRPRPAAPAPQAAPAAPAPQPVVAEKRADPGESSRLALEWLTRTQSPDGGWRVETQGATLDDHVAASSLAGIAIVGTGQKPPKAACAWLERQTPTRTSAVAMQALFLAERAGMFKQRGRPAAEAALARLIALQQKDGTWREEGPDDLARIYYPTVWGVLATKSAKFAGLKQADEALRLTHDTWAQSPAPQGTEALVCYHCTRAFLGWKKEELLTKDLAQVLATAPGPNADPRCFYARTLLAFQCEVLPKWLPHLEARLALQGADGSFEGVGGLDRTTTTALLTLSSEVALRFAALDPNAPPPRPTLAPDVPHDF
ncbi:MAG: hypothetical protein ABSE73_19220 [Planctomycetota bacterium]